MRNTDRIMIHKLIGTHGYGMELAAEFETLVNSHEALLSAAKSLLALAQVEGWKVPAEVLRDIAKAEGN